MFITLHRDSEIGNFNKYIVAAIAQLVEHFIRNEKVMGSSPIRGSIAKLFESQSIKTGFFIPY